METGLVCINGVRGYEKDGVAYLHIEDVAESEMHTEDTTKSILSFCNNYVRTCVTKLVRYMKLQ